jgi:integrase
MLLEAPSVDTLKGKRDRAILATLLYHGMRREELCKLRVRDLQQREGALHFRVHGKGEALAPFDVIRPTEPDSWTLPVEKVMILSRGTSFSAEDQHDIDTHALYRLWV